MFPGRADPVGKELGYDKDEASRMAAPFGGGMFRGDTCGAVVAAMIAIGMRYGHSELGDEEETLPWWQG